MNDFSIYSDGGSRGNPGPAGIGFVIKDSAGKVYKEGKKFLGEKTNNEAEYIALGLALKLKAKRVTCFLDSELVVKQLNGLYRVKEPRLALLFVKVKDLASEFDAVAYRNIPREKNKEADRLVNDVLDENAQ
jgi:ribonuclease HI